MQFHLIYCPATGEIFSIILSTLGVRLSPQCYIATIEKDLTVEQAKAKIRETSLLARGIASCLMALWGIKTEDLEEEAPESWERNPDWWKE